MPDALFAYEPLVRLLAFAGIFVVLALCEAAAPRRRQAIGRSRRWPNNLGVEIVNVVLLRILFPTTAVGIALVADARGIGLLHAIPLPNWIAVIVAVMVLDLTIYLQHVVFHLVPPLWRLHRMHHTDLELDVTSGVRFHPLEILISMLIKLAIVVVIGAPALAVLLFEVLLNATSMFNHANLAIPVRLDRVLRWIIVTPDMHRVHHSVEVAETNSNFGFNLPWWDRLFRTYRGQPAAGHDGMTIGIDAFREPEELRLDRMLAQPLRHGGEAYPRGSRDV